MKPSLRSLIVISLVQSFALAGLAAAQSPTPPPKRESARVVSVVTVDGLQLHIGGKPELVLLYGLKAPLVTTRDTKADRQQLAQVLEGKTVSIERRSKLGKLSQVIAYLDDGLCVNEYVISQGLAAWDRAAARDYESASKAEEMARANHTGIWNTGAGATAKVPPSAAAALQNFKQRNQLKQQAEFDAAFEKWASLEKSQQFAAISALRQLVGENDSTAVNALASLDEARRDIENQDDAAKERLQEHREDYLKLREAEQDQLQRILDDHPTRFGRRVYSASEQTAVSIAADERQIKADSTNTRQDFQSRRARKMDDIRATESERESLAAVKAGLDVEAQEAEDKRAALQYSLQAEIYRLVSMTEAARSGYSPVTRKHEIDRIEAPAHDAKLEIDVTSDVWRIDIQTPGDATDPSLSVDVSRDVEASPFTRLPADAPLLEQSLILDGPGSFTLHVRNPQDTACLVLVYAVD